MKAAMYAIIKKDFALLQVTVDYFLLFLLFL